MDVSYLGISQFIENPGLSMLTEARISEHDGRIC